MCVYPPYGGAVRSWQAFRAKLIATVLRVKHPLSPRSNFPEDRVIRLLTAAPITGRTDAMPARNYRDSRFIDARVGARLRQRRNKATAKEIARRRCTTRLILARP